MRQERTFGITLAFILLVSLQRGGSVIAGRCAIYFGGIEYTPAHVEMLMVSADSVRKASAEPLRLLLYDFGAALPSAEVEKVGTVGIEVMQLPTFQVALSELLGLQNVSGLFEHYIHAAKLLAIHHSSDQCQEVLVLDYDTLALRDLDNVWNSLSGVDIAGPAEPRTQEFNKQWSAYMKRRGVEHLLGSPKCSDVELEALKQELCRDVGASSEVQVVTPFQNSIMRLSQRALEHFRSAQTIRQYYHTLLRLILGGACPDFAVAYRKVKPDRKDLGDVCPDASTAETILRKLQEHSWAPETLRWTSLRYPAAYPIDFPALHFVAEMLAMWIYFPCLGLHIQVFPRNLVHNQPNKIDCAEMPALLHTQSPTWKLGLRVREKCSVRAKAEL